VQASCQTTTSVVFRARLDFQMWHRGPGLVGAMCASLVPNQYFCDVQGPDWIFKCGIVDLGWWV